MSSRRFWFDSELLWENPKDVRPYHVQTPWYWFPDSDVAGAMIKVKSVSAAVRQPALALPAAESLPTHLRLASPRLKRSGTIKQCQAHTQFVC